MKAARMSRGYKKCGGTEAEKQQSGKRDHVMMCSGAGCSVLTVAATMVTS